MGTPTAQSRRRPASMGGLAVLLALSAPLVCASQSPTQTILLHGFTGNPDSWNLMRYYLGLAFGGGISTTAPSWPGTGTFDQAAASFAGHFSQSATPVFLAHSAGGIVSRATDLRPDRQLAGIITVGTPHTGAPVSVNRWTLLPQFVQRALDIEEAPLYYLDLDGGHLDDFLLLLDVIVVLYYVGQDFQNVVTQLISPMAGELEPGSSYLNMLNGQTNLDREATSMGPRRFAIVSHAPSHAQVCANFFAGNWQSCRYIVDALILSYYERCYYYTYYSDYGDPYWLAKRQNAYRWCVGAERIAALNGWWCTVIGAPPAPGGCSADGLIPTVRQAWPGATNINIGEGSDPGPGHGAETEDDDVREIFTQLLLTSFNVSYAPGPPPAPPPPQPQPPGPAILGQPGGRPGNYCRWTAAVYTGNPPYNYQWRLNGQPVGTNSLEFGWTAMTGTHSLAVTVTDGIGLPLGIATMTVTIDAQQPECNYWF